MYISKDKGYIVDMKTTPARRGKKERERKMKIGDIVKVNIKNPDGYCAAIPIQCENRIGYVRKLGTSHTCGKYIDNCLVEFPQNKDQVGSIYWIGFEDLTYQGTI